MTAPPAEVLEEILNHEVDKANLGETVVYLNEGNIERIIAALDAAGWVLVPKVANAEMLAVMEPYAPDGHHCFEAIIRLLAARPR